MQLAQALINQMGTKIAPETTYDFTSLTALPSNYSWARTTVGTYFDSSLVLQTAAIGTARFDYKYDTVLAVAKQRGLLLEVSSTNLDTNSYLATSSESNVTTTTTGQTAPDGNSTANLFLFPATGCRYAADIQPVAGNYTMSIFIKSEGSYNIGFRATLLAGASLALKALTPTTSWVRHTASMSYPATANIRHGIDNRTAYGGSGVANSIYAVFNQFELGTYATSVIKTTTAAVTRSADTLTITATKAHSIKITYERQDTNVNKSSWIDLAVGDNTITASSLGVGCWIRTIRHYSRVLTAAEKVQN